MTQDQAQRPLPVPDETSAGFWSAAAGGEFALPRCSGCGSFCFPPAPVCPTCGSTNPAYSYQSVDGSGVIRSWTVVRDSFLPGFSSEVPYVLVDVQLDCQPGLRTIGRLLDGPGAALRLGDRVTVAFETVADGVAVPAFSLERT
jgi:uncharacterized OB-fold protein